MKRFKTRKVYFLYILILSVFLIAGCGETGHWDDGDDDSGNGDGGGSGSGSPTIILTAPLNNASNVAINTRITATFSEEMDPLTITSTTFTVMQDATPVEGAVTYSGVNAVFIPTSNLAISTTYTATVKTWATDLDGNELASDYVWSFTTGTSTDVTAPTVTLTVPADVATGVAIDAIVTTTFSEAMDPLTITTTSFTLRQGTTPVPGSVTYSGVNAVFTPASNLAISTTYTATITTVAADLAGNALESAYVWSFTTGASNDTTAPTVTLVNPLNVSTDVCINKVITATFSETMNPLTITNVNFTVAGVTGTVLNVALTNSATFTPASDLAINTTYTATISTGVMDLAGNSLETPYVWTFTTGETTCAAAVALGAAEPFGGFGGNAGMTNEGILTTINGDIGTTQVSTSVTGFHDSVGDVYTITGSNDGTVTGRIYTNAPPPGGAAVGGNAETMAIAQAALADAQIAYDNLSPAALPGGIDLGSDQLGGRTLYPGIYQAAGGSYQITGSDLILDGNGDANAVFVFQMASSLTVGAPGFPRSVLLQNGAQAKNVFWQVGSAATINAAGGGTMVGTIIAYSGVAFSTSGNVALVTLDGRALSLVASVTMTNTIINVPEP